MSGKSLAGMFPAGLFYFRLLTLFPSTMRKGS